MLDSSLYSRRESNIDTMSDRQFMVAITGFTALLIIVSMVGTLFSYSLTFTNDFSLVIFMLVCTAVSVGGALLAHSNEDPLTSIVGGAVCALAMGVMAGPFVAMFENGSVIRAFTLTAGIVIVTGFIGALLPYDISSWGAPLIGLLFGVIVIQFGGIIATAAGFDMNLAFSLLDWVVLLLFCAIMVYDLSMARRLDYTLDNAIDVAVSVFLNFANIFIRALAIIGKTED